MEAAVPRGGIEPRRHAEGGVGTLAGGPDARLGDRPLGSCHIHAGMIIEGHKRERTAVPFPQRPTWEISPEVLFQELLQCRIVKRPSLELGRRLLGR